jgi:hypothetical protein
LTAHNPQIPCIQLITGQQSGMSSSNRLEKQKRQLFIHYWTDNQKLKQTKKKQSNQEPKLKQTEKTRRRKESRKTNLDFVSRTRTSESTKILQHPA